MQYLICMPAFSAPVLFVLLPLSALSDNWLDTRLLERAQSREEKMNTTSGTPRLYLNRMQGCPWTGCWEVWSMPTTVINISSRDMNIMVYRKANLWGFFPWMPGDVDNFFSWSRLVLQMTVFRAKLLEAFL